MKRHVLAEITPSGGLRVDLPGPNGTRVLIEKTLSASEYRRVLLALAEKHNRESASILDEVGGG